MSVKKNKVVRKLHGTKVREEYQSSGVAIIPGMLLELTSTAERIQAHSTAGGDAYPLIADNDEHHGGDIDTPYAAAAGTKIICWMPRRGDEAHMILVDGSSVVRGDLLESDGTGRLQKHNADVDPAHDSDDADAALTIYTNKALCIALEDKDLSDSSGAEDSGSLDYDYRLSVKFI